MCSIEHDKQRGSICGVEQYQGNWERVPVTLDSGAVHSVIPRRYAQVFQVKQTEASRRGMGYRAANGTKIVNEGQRDIRGYTKGGNLVDMAMNVCDVTKPLGSAMSMMKAGNRIVLDEEGSYILNKASGKTTGVEDRDGSLVFDIWVPKKDSAREQGYQGKYFQALVEDEDHSGFARLDDLM